MPCPTGLTYRDGAPIIYDPADYPAAFDRLLATLDYAGLAPGAGEAPRERAAPRASASAPTSRAPASGPSRAPTSGWTPTAPCSCTWASARRARGTRPRSPRSPPMSWRCRSNRSWWWAATPASWATAWGPSPAAWPRWAGPRCSAPPRRWRTRRGWWRPSCSSARRRTSCSPTGACTSAACRARASTLGAGRARRGAEPRARRGGRPGAQRLRLLLSRHGHLGLRRAGRRRSRSTRDVRDLAAPARRHARLRAPDQPDDRRGPAPRRHRPGHRQPRSARS